MFQGICVIDHKFDNAHTNLFLKVFFTLFKIQFPSSSDAKLVYQKLNGLVWHYETLHKIQAHYITEETGIERINTVSEPTLKSDVSESCGIFKFKI